MELRIKHEVINGQNRFVIVDEKDNIINSRLQLFKKK